MSGLGFTMGCPGWTAELDVHWLRDRNDGRAEWKRPQEVPSATSTTATTRDQSHAGAWWVVGSTPQHGSRELLCGDVQDHGWDGRKHKVSTAPALDLCPMVPVGCGKACPFLGCGSADKPGVGDVRGCLNLPRGGTVAGLCVLACIWLESRASPPGGWSSALHLGTPRRCWLLTTPSQSVGHAWGSSL